MRITDYKLYLKPAQERVLSEWLRGCCRIHNMALEQRIKAYKRRKEFTSMFTQMLLLTEWRRRIPWISEIPVLFARNAIRRVDYGMKGFFRRVKSGQAPGFPRFKSSARWNSMEMLETGDFLRNGMILIPKLGLVKARGRGLVGKQKALRIIRRPSGWYAQILVDCTITRQKPMDNAVGVDMGINSVVALSTGEVISNPKYGDKSAARLRHAQRVMERRQRGSKNRKKAVHKIGRVQELSRLQRRSFCHALSTRLVQQNSLIAFEKLNIVKLARAKLARCVNDAGWGFIQRQTAYKAAEAGAHVVFVDPSGTSQECPECGRLQSKLLSERIHRCPCGCQMDRDVAAAKVILSRALRTIGDGACGGDISPSSTLVVVGGGSNETGSLTKDIVHGTAVYSKLDSRTGEQP